ENSLSTFSNRASLPYIFTGEHSFSYLPSESSPGHTTLVQREVFSGALSFVMGEGFLARQMGMTETTNKNWLEYNTDFKVWCE
ncbi:hypothetical protein K432DRAFT_260734, partial [Lepidopterella palustris CBS 459.81]